MEQKYHLDSCEEVTALHKFPDAVIGLERDQQSGSEHADTTVRIIKNRYSGGNWHRLFTDIQQRHL